MSSTDSSMNAIKSDVDINDIRDNLEVAQQRHLNFLESWGSESRTVSNVPVLQLFTYEVIQVMNNFYLGSVLGENDDNGEGDDNE